MLFFDQIRILRETLGRHKLGNDTLWISRTTPVSTVRKKEAGGGVRGSNFELYGPQLEPSRKAHPSSVSSKTVQWSPIGLIKFGRHLHTTIVVVLLRQGGWPHGNDRRADSPSLSLSLSGLTSVLDKIRLSLHHNSVMVFSRISSAQVIHYSILQTGSAGVRSRSRS